MSNASTSDTQNDKYVPPKVWTQDKDNGGKFASINRPTSGARYDKELPVGDAPLQLYSLNTPNGVKVNILLEELAELGISGAEYDAYKIDISQGEQFGSGFVAINPNSKIPALVDHSAGTAGEPIALFESGAILMYLAEKFDRFLPLSLGKARADCLSWVMWQMGSAPFLGGGFGHFYAYAPEPLEYPINRYTMETKRQLDVLDTHLKDSEYLCGNDEADYNIADMIIWAWYGQLVLGKLYDAAEFLQVQDYKHIQRWAKKIAERPAVKRAVELELKPID
ncbi:MULTISPECIES: glutathione-dependent disulfide-bond oxidoreductase [Psychrobacter]|uniref:GST-like protein n=2 Tax=Psychrobacter TaxID=497 RepID=A0A1G6ZUD5_9GAMM|nr:MULTISPECIES: glutathione-dependent disulfide-bond oxidoreductase [Psychrobacter]MED6318079.1 glutathione-dependent disulfide-bond oxidoreductase [Pseudomonadota bacterium]HBD03933.1 glutathione-dependent disulfide-bond oxidoreductase [Psychrobacter sp.]MBZ1391396.1 glutathione-dependent disulfide-bond oxidoreductase [Psychrobacter pacificensis]MDH4904835.1 glutathione-dependent disulfide-bond oxidoreductase [Psychrobacter pocilloporae]SDE06120.1 GST-like protein [Psychrobacter pacificensis|tara:strand:- start:384 stop:1223 length:840 start_codon:yes stop_codon:yes gene_type:complete